jgi:hypothetical protein
VKLSLSYKKAMPLYIVLTEQLDGYEKIIVGPDGKDKVVRCLYELGAVRLDIARNANRVKTIIVEYEAVRIACVKKLAGDKDAITQQDNPKEFADFIAEMTPLQDKESEIEVTPLNRSICDANQFPITALVVLDEIGMLVE